MKQPVFALIDNNNEIRKVALSLKEVTNMFPKCDDETEDWDALWNQTDENARKFIFEQNNWSIKEVEVEI